MSFYKYEAYDKMGAKIFGEIEANSVEKASQELHKQNLVVVNLKVAVSRKSFNLPGLENKKVSLKSLEFITSEIALLLRSGVKFDRGLSILLKGASEPALVSLLNDLSKDVKAGKSIGDSFAHHPDVFDALYISMIRLGEASGKLQDVFFRLSADLKFKRSLQQKIIQALTYPSVILFVCIGAILFVFNYIVPQMAGLFDNATNLPVYTAILLGLSEWFINYQFYLAVAIAISIFALMRAYKSKDFQRKSDEFILGLPLVGNAFLLVERIRFNSSMAMMLGSGVSLVQALTLSSATLKNEQIVRLLRTSVSKVKQGDKLSTALSSVPLLTDFNLSMLEVGEESGELAPVFDEISERSRTDFETWVQTLTSMIEPLLILFMGAIVGSVVVVMLLSIISTNDIAI
jgi:type II secretory pathway component PulF